MESVISQSIGLGVGGQAMVSVKTVTPQRETGSSASKQGENTLHRLKLQWMIAQDETERRKISEEIRRQLGTSTSPARPS